MSQIIRADTDQLRAVARQMRAAADQIAGGHDGMQQAMSALDATWSGRARERGMARWAVIAPKYRPSADGLIEMANGLEDLVRRIDGAAAVFGASGGGGGGKTVAPGPTPAPPTPAPPTPAPPTPAPPDSTITPYLTLPTDPAARAALIARLPREMQTSIMNGPARTVHNAPLQIPIADLNRDSYTALVNQFMSCPQNPRYAPSHGLTYCDVFVRDVLASTGTNVKEYGSVNAIADSLGADPHWEIVSAEVAQQRADSGMPAVAILRDPAHTAMIVPDNAPFSASRGPRIAQAGAGQFMIDDNKHLIDGFGKYKSQTYYIAYKGP